MFRFLVAWAVLKTFFVGSSASDEVHRTTPPADPTAPRPVADTKSATKDYTEENLNSLFQASRSLGSFVPAPVGEREKPPAKDYETDRLRTPDIGDLPR